MHAQQEQDMGTIRGLVRRLEEKEAVLATLEACWDNGGVSDTHRRRIVSDVRRSLVDTICDLEGIGSPS